MGRTVSEPSEMDVLGMLNDGAKDCRICAVSVKPARRISWAVKTSTGTAWSSAV